MISKTTQRFRERLSKLPNDVRKQTASKYRLFCEDPDHPSINFKKVHPDKPVYSARITIKYRAVGIIEDKTIVWFWVGTHSEYEELLKHL